MSRRIAAVLTMLLGLVMIFPLITRPVLGDAVEKYTICHASGLEGTTHFETLELPFEAVFGEAGHFFENGTPRAGHEQDLLSPCPETSTTTEGTVTSTTETPPTTVNDEPSTTTTEGSTTTTTEASTTTTTEGSTTTSEGGTTSTSNASTTTSPSVPTTTLVGVNPICIDCNNATQADLQQLTGVNATLAAAIIANRPYETLQDLVTKQVMTQVQLFLIVAVNLNTGAFAGPECLSAAIGTTTTIEQVTSTTTTLGVTPVTSGNLPFTGLDALPIGALASGIMGIGLMFLGWTMRKEPDGDQ